MLKGVFFSLGFRKMWKAKMVSNGELSISAAPPFTVPTLPFNGYIGNAGFAESYLTNEDIDVCNELFTEYENIAGFKYESKP